MRDSYSVKDAVLKSSKKGPLPRRLQARETPVSGLGGPDIFRLGLEAGLGLELHFTAILLPRQRGE